jgi:hypothetical protein
VNGPVTRTRRSIPFEALRENRLVPRAAGEALRTGALDRAARRRALLLPDALVAPALLRAARLGVALLRATFFRATFFRVALRVVPLLAALLVLFLFLAVLFCPALVRLVFFAVFFLFAAFLRVVFFPEALFAGDRFRITFLRGVLLRDAADRAPAITFPPEGARSSRPQPPPHRTRRGGTRVPVRNEHSGRVGTVDTWGHSAPAQTRAYRLQPRSRQLPMRLRKKQ